MRHLDYHPMTGGMPNFGSPVPGGHEGVGTIVDIGPGVEDLAVGDHVVLSFIPSCGMCPPCQASLRNLCDLDAGLPGGASCVNGSARRGGP